MRRCVRRLARMCASFGRDDTDAIVNEHVCVGSCRKTPRTYPEYAIPSTEVLVALMILVPVAAVRLRWQMWLQGVITDIKVDAPRVQVCRDSGW